MYIYIFLCRATTVYVMLKLYKYVYNIQIYELSFFSLISALWLPKKKKKSTLIFFLTQFFAILKLGFLKFLLG